jgi:hypothetical protein
MLATLVAATPFFTPSVTSYMGVFLGGKKVGYVSYNTSDTTFEGKPATLTTSKTRMKIGLIGSEVEMKIDSETISIEGKRLKMNFSQESSGRKQTVEAWFKPSIIELKINNNGSITNQKLPLPKDGVVVDDPVTEFVMGTIDGSKSFYVLDPTTISLVKNSIKVIGDKSIDLNGQSVAVKELEVVDPRLSTSIFVNGKGDVVKVSTTIGIEMMPLDEAAALADSEESGNPDLANLTSIVPKPAIEKPMTLSRLRMYLTAENMPLVISDGQQSAKKVEGKWLIDIHPIQLTTAKTVSIDQARTAKPEWVKPSLHIPANSSKFKKLAKTIIGKKTDVRSASLAIRSWVNNRMTVNAGIGVLRDANEILTSPEGVCRDYAILTATICRAAGIPTRLASGLVNFDGNFYYHAWVEVYTGFDWIGMDSVPSGPQFSATHVKLGQGNVDKAFTFTVLSKAEMTVLEVKN